MNRTTVLWLIVAGTLLTLQSGATVALADPPHLDIPFGTLVSDSTCPAATHALYSPCDHNVVGFYVVFQSARNLERFEGKNVAIRGTVDQNACPKPLILAKRIVISNSVPPCPPPPS